MPVVMQLAVFGMRLFFRVSEIGVAYTSVRLLLVLVSTAMGNARSLCKSERARVRLPRLPCINTKPIEAGARESVPASKAL